MKTPPCITSPTTYRLFGTSGASARARVFVSPVTYTLTRYLTFHRLSSARHRATLYATEAGGVSAGCYFKSCQSPVIAPVLQRPERDVVKKAEEGKHGRVVSLPGGSAAPLNEKTTNYCVYHDPPSPLHHASPSSDSMSSPEFFAPDISAHDVRLASVWQSRSRVYVRI